MFEKFRRSRERDRHDTTDYDRGAEFQGGDGYGDDATTTRTAGTRTAVADRDYDGDGRTEVMEPRRAGTHTVPAGATAAATGPATAEEAHAIQRERFGGADGTAIFFGWLSALGLAALLLAVVGAAGTRLGYGAGVDTTDATRNAGTIGIVGAAILVVVLLLAYYAGGYVAGRMARFDGGRQGLRVWLLGLLVTIAAAVAGWIGGSQYNVYEQLNLPRIPVDEGDIATGAVITLALVVIGTVLAAVAGGKAGERYHSRIDSLAWDADTGRRV
jgi:hypothetical protein